MRRKELGEVTSQKEYICQKCGYTKWRSSHKDSPKVLLACYNCERMIKAGQKIITRKEFEKNQ